MIAYYNVKRCFGFIKRAKPGEKVYFYLTACSSQTPVPTYGEKVLFAEKKGKKGAVATTVLRTPNKSTGAASASTSAPDQFSGVPLVGGVVKEYKVLGAYGTVVTDTEAELHFVLASCDVKRPPPTVGERVMVNETVGKKGPTASIVHRPTVQEAEEPVKGKPKPKAASPRTPNVFGVKMTESAVSQAQRIAEQTRAKLQEVPSDFDGGKHPRYVFVDLDNIWISFARAEHLVGNFPGAESTRDLVLHLEGLTRRLASGEPGSSVARLVAFYYKTPPTIAHRLKKLIHDGVRWEVRKQETVSDTSMQLELLNAKRPCEAHPKTLVLATGDGNIAPNGMCFRSILDLYLRDGWYVEVHAWLATMARTYIEFQREYSSTVVIRPLDDDLHEIVAAKKDLGTGAGQSAAERGADLLPGIVTKYEPLGGFGVIAKLDGSGGDLHFAILDCDHRRPPPTIGERVMLTEGVSKKWGPCAATVRRISIEVDSEDATSGESKQGSVASNDNDTESKPALVSPAELSAALTRAMDMVLADTTSTSSSSDDGQQHTAQPSQDDAPVNADEYRDMIRLLSIPETSETNLPSAIALLEREHPDEAAAIQVMDPATQRVVLVSIFQEEVDSELEFDLDLDLPASPSSPIGTIKQSVENGSPQSHPEPEPEPSHEMQCKICKDDVLIDDVVLVGGCDHAFCSLCLRSYAVDRIDQEDVKPECPHQGCASVLSDVDLARVLSIDEQKKYYDARMKLTVGGVSEVTTSL